MLWNDYYKCVKTDDYFVFKEAEPFNKTNWTKSLYNHIIFRRLNSVIMAVTMNPKPEKLQTNVTLKFRHLKVTTHLKQIVCSIMHLFQWKRL